MTVAGSQRTALYRHYDAAGALLYVGISLCAIGRLSQHRRGAEWFDQIARVDIEWFPSRDEAETAERAAIGLESPRHNIVGRADGSRSTPAGSGAAERVALDHVDAEQFDYLPDSTQVMLCWNYETGAVGLLPWPDAGGRVERSGYHCALLGGFADGLTDSQRREHVLALALFVSRAYPVCSPSAVHAALLGLREYRESLRDFNTRVP